MFRYVEKRVFSNVDAFRNFITQYPVVTYKKGETILLKAEMPRGVYVIESGFVKTYGITRSGNEQLVSIDAANEEFPLGYAVHMIEKSEYFYEALTKCKVRIVPREEYMNYLDSDMQRLYFQYKRVTKLLLGTIAHVHALEQASAREKIAFLLIYMGQQLGVAMKPHTTTLKLSVTQQEIADSIGVARETANIELKNLEALQLIVCSRRSYTLYMDKLEEYVEKR